MRGRIILDTGPLVALLNARDTYHDWAKAQFGAIEPPLLSCEAVIFEACFLVRGLPRGPRAVLGLVLGFSGGEHTTWRKAASDAGCSDIRKFGVCLRARGLSGVPGNGQNPLG